MERRKNKKEERKAVYIGQMRTGEFFLLAAIHGAACLSVFLMTGIVGYVFFRGFRGLSLRFFTSASSFLEEKTGIAGNIVNTLYLLLLALGIAIPLGVGAAVYLNEYAGKGRLVRAVSLAVDTLAGIPSVIFGLFGMVFFGEAMGLGYSLLSGSLTLALMILPLIVKNTRMALEAVPEGYRQGALGMGAGKWELIKTILLPAAKNGIATGIFLSAGRILGESAALLFTAGSAGRLPRLGRGLLENMGVLGDKVWKPGGSLAVELYLQMQNGEYGTAFAIGAALVFMILLLNLLLRWFLV